jgi:hypothetical protein
MVENPEALAEGLRAYCARFPLDGVDQGSGQVTRR